MSSNIAIANDAIPIEEEQPKSVSIWQRIFAHEHQSTETKTYKKSAFGKIMKLYHEKLEWACQKLAEIRSPEMKEEEGNYDLEGDSYRLSLIMQNYAEFFANYSAVIFKHELMFADIPFRKENRILGEVLIIGRKVPELASFTHQIIGKMLNTEPTHLDLAGLHDMASEYHRSLYLVDRVPKKGMDQGRFIRRLGQLADISHQSTGFVVKIFSSWYATWDELGIDQYLPCSQVRERIRLARWLGECSRHYNALVKQHAYNAHRIDFFEMMGVEADSELTTGSGSLRLIHPRTYEGQESFAFLFED